MPEGGGGAPSRSSALKLRFIRNSCTGESAVRTRTKGELLQHPTLFVRRAMQAHTRELE